MSELTLAALQEKIPGYGRDIRLNLDSVLTPSGAPGLNETQIAGTALACAYAVEDLTLSSSLAHHFAAVLTPETLEAAKGAATLMAMNNVYYRFLHLAEDKELSKLPARLRMNLIGKPGIAKVDFELMSLAVSAIAGCGSCINSHVAEVRKAGVSDEGVQSAVRIASVVVATRRALAIASTPHP
jgi:lipoyl-dependent peroxiredoxin subunit D